MLTEKQKMDISTKVYDAVQAAIPDSVDEDKANNVCCKVQEYLENLIEGL